MPIELLVYGCWWLIIRITIYLEELLPEIGIEPAIEDWVADTGAEGDTVAQTQDEVIHLVKEGGHDNGDNDDDVQGVFL